MRIIYPLHVTVFGVLPDNGKKEMDTPGQERLCATLYLKNSEKYRSSDLKKRAKNDYVLNKAKYLRTITEVQSLLLN